MQDCCNSIANAQELLQSCTKLSIFTCNLKNDRTCRYLSQNKFTCNTRPFRGCLNPVLCNVELSCFKLLPCVELSCFKLLPCVPHRNPVYGQRWTQHKWIPVLPDNCHNKLVSWGCWVSARLPKVVGKSWKYDIVWYCSDLNSCVSYYCSLVINCWMPSWGFHKVIQP